MIEISDSTRTIIWIITGVSSFMLSILFTVLEDDLRYFMRGTLFGKRGGRKPTRKPKIVWLFLIILISISLIGTVVASLASPALPTTEPPLFTLPDFILDIAPSTIVVASTISGGIILIILVALLMKQFAARVQNQVERLKNKENEFFQIVTSDFQSLFEEKF